MYTSDPAVNTKLDLSSEPLPVIVKRGPVCSKEKHAQNITFNKFQTP